MRGVVESLPVKFAGVEVVEMLVGGVQEGGVLRRGSLSSAQWVRHGYVINKP